MLVNVLVLSLSVTLVTAMPGVSISGGEPSVSIMEVSSRDTLTLYCPLYVTNNSVILWSKDNRIVFAGELRVRMDARYAVVNDNLVITEVNTEDAGTFTCQVRES